MRMVSFLWLAALAPSLAWCVPSAASQAEPIPDVRQLLREVTEHQKQLEKVRETYTYSSERTIQEIDARGQVRRTETELREAFFVNGHAIERLVKKNGQPLSPREQQKETERIAKLVEKAQKTPSDQPLEEQGLTVARLLQIMDVRNPRREMYQGRPALVFDFVGRKDVKTHGLAEDMSKKLEGTVWIDEADRQVTHLEVSFKDNFRIAGGLLASIQKGSSFHFDQARVNGEIWLPTGGEGAVQARVLLLKNYREHFTERDFGYQRFRVDAEQAKGARVVDASKP